MGLEKPSQSSNVGAICPTCLPKFSVHFRRPYEILRSAEDQKFDGSYGFDWVRDEYFNKLMIKEDNSKPETVFISNNPKDIESFKSNYLSNNNVWGKEYLFSYLWMFPGNIIKKNNYKHLKNKVSLNLELNLIDEDILNKNFFIEFVSSHENLKIIFKGSQYSSIKLHFSEILLGNKKNLFEKASKGNGKKIRDYFNIENFLELISLNDGYDEDQNIAVYVGEQENNINEYVGGMIVFKNKKNKKAKLKVVKVFDGIDFDIHQEIALILKEKVLGQALVEVDYLGVENLDLKKIYNIDIDVKRFTNRYYRKKYFDSDGVRFLPQELWSDYMADLSLLYKKIKKLNFDLGSPENPITYLFFTNLNPGSIFVKSKKIALNDLGVSLNYVDEHNDSSSGNVIVMFNAALQNTGTIIHEVTHSFNAPHPFERQQLSLHQGFTDLVLDYDYFEKKAILSAKSNESLYMKFKLDDSNLLDSLPDNGVIVLDLRNQLGVVEDKATVDESDLYFGETTFKSQIALNVLDVEDIQNDYSAR